MARDALASVTDNVDDVLAAHINQFKTAIDKIERAVAYADFATATTASGNITLTDSSNPIQSIDCNGANRVVTLPAVAVTNGAFFVLNKTAATYTITVKNAGGTVIAVVYPGRAVMVVCDGAAWYRIGGHHVTYTILTSGSGTYTTPDGVTALEIEMLGGGGGGGGAKSTSAQAAAGAGGGGGAYLRKRIDGPSATYAYSVGALGAGGAAGQNNGSAGGDTTFGSLTAGGGSGGNTPAVGTTNTRTTGGAGGTATGGDVNAAGPTGINSMRFDGTLSVAGTGASTQFGGGGKAAVGINADGNAATGYGAGGGGGATSNSTTDRAGGDGTGGIIIIREIRE
jgi:hypothetical protein